MDMEAHSKTDVAEVYPHPLHSHPHGTDARFQLQQALQTAQLELDLERSHRIVEGVARDEDIRKLRCQILLLEDENDELHDQLAEEESRADRLEGTLDDSLEQLRVKEAEVLRLQNELRVKARASDTMKVSKRVGAATAKNQAHASYRLNSQRWSLYRPIRTKSWPKNSLLHTKCVR